MSKRTQIEELLAGDRLSEREKKQIFQRVSAQARPKRQWLWVGGLLAATAACALFVLTRVSSTDFTSRGRPGVLLSAACADTCHTGSTLLFSYDGPRGASELRVRLTAPNGDHTELSAPAERGAHAASRGAVLDQAGAWQVDLQLVDDKGGVLGLRTLSVEAAP